MLNRRSLLLLWLWEITERLWLCITCRKYIAVSVKKIENDNKNSTEVCPACEKVCEVERISYTKEIDVLGEKIDVPCELFKCLECGNEFDDPKDPTEELDLAYQEYRKRHNMVKPEEITSIRKILEYYGEKLSTIIGISEEELYSYEHGCLHDKRIDSLLQKVKKIFFKKMKGKQWRNIQENLPLEN